MVQSSLDNKFEAFATNERAGVQGVTVVFNTKDETFDNAVKHGRFVQKLINTSERQNGVNTAFPTNQLVVILGDYWLLYRIARFNFLRGKCNGRVSINCISLYYLTLRGGCELLTLHRLVMLKYGSQIKRIT